MIYLTSIVILYISFVAGLYPKLNNLTKYNTIMNNKLRH